MDIFINKMMKFSNSSSTIASMINDINNVLFGGIDVQPHYQRGYVWKNDFKDKLIYSIIKSYPIGNISIRVLNTPNDKGAYYEIVDGQQRLTTIRDFITGEYSIRSEWSRNIINVIKEYFSIANVEDDKLNILIRKLSNKGLIKLKYNDLPDIIQRNINNYNISQSVISDSTDSQITEYFRFLQNQEVLRAGEIINSMPATRLECFIKKILDKDLFLDKISFNDNRKEFDKIFYSIIGLFDSKISFGTTDKTIQNYVSNANIPELGLSQTEEMVRQINVICSDKSVNLNTTRKRFLKYLLLLCGFGYVDFSKNTKQKLLHLKEIDDKLSVFFSAKSNVVENEYIGYSQDVIEEMRLIALLTKGSHSRARVENRIKILAHYVNNDNIKNNTSGIELIENIHK